MKENIKYNFIYKCVAVFFPFIISLYISRSLGAEKVGALAVALNRTSYFVSLAALGIPNYGIREVARRRNDICATKKLIYELLIISAISTLVSLLIFWLYINMLHVENTRIYFIYGSLIVANIISVDWYFFGNEKYKYIAIRSLIVKIVSFCLILLCVHDSDDYYIYAVLYCVGIIGNSFFNIVYLLKDVGIYNGVISFKPHIKPILYMFFSVIAVDLYSKIDISMLGIYNDNYSVACYSYSVKLVKMLAVVFFSFTSVVLPRLSKGKEGHNEKDVSSIIRIIIILCFGTMIGIYSISDNITLVLWGKEYEGSIIILKILAPLVFICPLGNLFGVQILTSFNAEKTLLYTNILGLIINVCCNFLMIPRYGYIGAAFASVMCEFTVMIVQWIVSKKYIKIHIETVFLIKVAISGIVLFYVEKMIHNMFGNSIIDILVSILAGLFGYFGILFLLHLPMKMHST
jgi:O-antigen/teichoic acid export membrane protein